MPLNSLFGNQNSNNQNSIFNGGTLLNQFNQTNGWSRGDAQGAVATNGMSAMPTGVNPIMGNVNGWNLRTQNPNSATGWSEANVNGNGPVDMNTLDWKDYNNPGGWAGPLIGTAALAGVGGSIFGPMFSGAAPAAEGAGAASGIADPLAGYMTTGASEGSTIGGSLFGGGGAGAVGSGSLAGSVGSLQNLFTNPLGGQTGNKMTGNIISNLVKGAIGGGSGSGGISTIGNLGSLFTNYNQYKQTGDLMNQIKNIYSPDSPYAKYMEEQLGRKDAAAGRNSQYGPRLAQLMGILGEGQARSLSGLFNPIMQQQGGLNGMVGAGSRLLTGSGLGDWITQQLGGGSQGGMLAGELGQTPSTWDRVGDNVDWESLFGG